MLNYLWAFMMVAGVLWAAFHGNLSAVTDGALSSAKRSGNALYYHAGGYVILEWNYGNRTEVGAY